MGLRWKRLALALYWRVRVVDLEEQGVHKKDVWGWLLSRNSGAALYMRVMSMQLLVFQKLAMLHVHHAQRRTNMDNCIAK